MRKKILLIGTILFFTGASLRAAFELRQRGGRSTAMGGAYCAVSNDSRALWWNPAGLGLMENMDLSAGRADFYDLSDIKQMDVAVGLPVSSLFKGGAGYSVYGNSDYG
ncbi:MAG: hypothetical protein ACQESB_06060, partial [Elusimicrobiota bacterium]